MSRKKLLDTPFEEIRQAIQNYFSTKERVEKAERAKFLRCPRRWRISRRFSSAPQRRSTLL